MSKAVTIAINARDNASAAFRRAGAAAGGFGKSLMSVKGLVAGALGGFALKASLDKALEAWGVQEQAQAKLAATLRATGGAAGFTADQLQKYAADLQQATIFGDEAIINGQAILATFKQIQGDTFERATRAMLDMTATMGGDDLKGASIQLGKALNDPLNGLTALTRVGVTFSEAQKQQIKQFTAMGEVTKAQAVILDELEGEFGGVAAAMAQTSTGAMKQFRNAVGDVWESVGQALAPALRLTTDELQNMLPSLQEVIGHVGEKLSTATAIAGWAMTNWRDLGASAVLSVQLRALSFYEDMKYWFSEAMPTYLGWFGRNWKEVFIDALNAVGYAFENFGRNVWTIMGEVWDYITSWGSEGFEEGWENQLRGLMDGFTSVIQEEFPSVADRAFTDVETTLAAALADVQGRLGGSLAEALAAREAAMKSASNLAVAPARSGQETPSGLAAKANQNLAATEARFLSGQTYNPAVRAALDTAKSSAAGNKLLRRLIDTSERQTLLLQQISASDEQDGMEDIG